MITRLTLAIALLAVSVFGADGPSIYRNPAISKTSIVFEHASDLWLAPRSGGTAIRLTSGPGIETQPVFSPDGSQIAFTGEYDGNVDVYTIPAAGGVPKRVTYHPSADTALGWTPDGKRILFASNRASSQFTSQLFTISPDGGPEERLPLPIGYEGAYSPDGAQIAYVPMRRAFNVWKRYRGGTTTPVWIADLATSKVEKLPRPNSNDFNPMWTGGKVWFLSDREGPVTLFSYDPKSKRVVRAVENKGLDFKSAGAASDAIALERFGSIHIYDLKSGKLAPVAITVSGDMPEVRERLVNVSSRLRGAGISPSGARAVFEARGEILTVPAEKGDPRNITNTTGVMERDPVWSPDGQSIAYFSDASGEYELHIAPQNGVGEVKKVKLDAKPTFYSTPRWSPDSKKIAYLDAHMALWYVDVSTAGAAPVKVDKNRYWGRSSQLAASWSPDSKWIAYTKSLPNYLGAIHLFSIESGKTTQFTDGMSDAAHPVFDAGGKFLYFTASTDSGASLQPDIHSAAHPTSRSIYLAVLTKDEPSPFAPESDEEKPAAKAADAAKPAGEAKPAAEAKPVAGAKPAAAAKPVEVKIDFDNILQRVLAVPMPARRYVELQVGKAGTLIAMESQSFLFSGGGQSGATVHRFDLKARRADVVAGGVSYFQMSAGGEKYLVRRGTNWSIATLRPIPPAGAPATPPSPAANAGGQNLNTANLEVRVNPRDEWPQMYREAWRVQREFFYDPALHGVDIEATSKKYEPYVANVNSRRDLNYVFADMMGEVTAGHLGVGGGDTPEVKRVATGLLGADYEVANGRYRFARIYNGENWDPQMRAPLTQPGVNVNAGDYLLAVNGRNLTSADSLYRFFEATSGKQTVIRVGANPNGDGARDVTVVPVPNEFGLRNLAWIEGNRRKVDQMTNGRVAYIYMPDTSMGGYRNFNRYFYAQVGKDAAIIDERYNGGGALATDIVEMLTRKHLSNVATRDGEDEQQPQGAIFGPKIMLINEFAGSGGDAMPWYFRRAGAGKLLGKRTWGGLIGRAGAPSLMDGGMVSAPSSGVWDPATSKWIAENVGVEPDIEVENEPDLVRQGKDPQLEKAVELIMAELAKNPPSKAKRPAYPNYQKPGGVPGPDTANSTRR